MNASIPVFDRELALQRAGGREDLAAELFAMLLQDLPVQRKRIVASRDAVPDLIEIVHKLNGAATYCGVPALKSAAHDYETALKLGQQELLDALHQQLISEIDRVLANADNARF